MTQGLKEPDIFADIIPGRSAAGFSIGQHFNQFTEIVDRATCWDKSQQLGWVVDNTDDWLLIENIQLAAGLSPYPVDTWRGCRLCFGRGAVMLHFNQDKFLNYIEVGVGYRGALYEVVRVGDELRSVLEFCNLEYDDVEELHLPANGNDVGLISFYAEEQSLESSPNQKIHCIFIGDFYHSA